MPLTNTQYASIMRLYDDIKTANRRMQSDRYNEVTALCPDIAVIDSEIIDLSVKTARARIEADSSDTNTDELTSSLKSLNERKVAALASIGKPADYLDDIFTCPYCKDSGYVNGKRCICFNKKAIDLIYEDSNLKNITSSENFSTFSFEWYDKKQVDPVTGLTPYNNMHKVLDVCQSFVQTFDNSFSNLLLTGETGVGKTFLANCIAKELLDTYHSVIYLTATEFFKCFENSDFRRNLDNSIDVNYFLECDLLIIDDLGTESSNSYTNSKLFYVINERLLRNKSVIISSNFTISQIEDFYSERIFSRIISSYTILRLFGTDIRYLKRTKMLKN